MAVHLGLGTRRILASTMVASVPSEPTIMRAKLNGCGFDEFVEIVAGDAPHDFRIAREDFVFMLLRQTKHFAVRAPFDRIGFALLFDFCRRQIFQHHFAAVGQQAPSTR